MTEDLLEYPKMMENAMRGVMREALSITAAHGLPGLHHFYITFRTEAPGVSISNQLLAQYPQEMTIVLENEFSNLEVTDDGFSVSLSFSRVLQNLVIPFDAVKSFVDPSVKFGLQFSADGEAAPAPEDKAEDDTGDTDDADDTGDGRVVTLDSFRKK